MRLKTKNTNIFHAQTTKNTKNKTTKKKKQTTTINCCYFYRIRVHYTVLTQHTTPQTTPNQTQPKNTGRNQQKVLLTYEVIL